MDYCEGSLKPDVYDRAVTRRKPGALPRALVQDCEYSFALISRSYDEAHTVASAGCVERSADPCGGVQGITGRWSIDA